MINGDVGRRTWTAERKGEIVAESMQPGVIVSEVARRHNLTPQQLFSWRHDAKQGRLALPEEAMSFVPVVATVDDEGSPLPAPRSPAFSTRTKGQIEINLGAAVIKVPDDVQPKYLAKVLRAVKVAL